MRSEEEMYRLILNTAENDHRIYAVYMNGSRTNKSAKKDIFQDYDVVYVVKETESFIRDKKWIENFGQILYMQYPDENPDFPNDKENFYGWLIQFTDGNRMDIHVESLKHAKEHITDDKLCSILLDKENVLPQIPESTDKDRYVKKASKEQYHAVCNEFWWCLNNVAKGLWRNEMTYVQDMVNFSVRKQLERVLGWKIGIITDYSVSIGKCGKYMYRWLDKDEWNRYLSTYFRADQTEAWDAVFKMCDLFEETAVFVGDKLGYEYDRCEAENARGYLEHIRKLPKDAQQIY